ncbi:MAG: tetratricopeptide repeat protein [Thermoanaerobaculia bacterium]
MKLAMRLLLPALLLVAVVAQVRRSSDMMRAQHLIYSVERRTLAMLRTGDLDKAKLRAHLAALEDARKLDWAEVQILTLTGGQHLMLGEIEPARRAYIMAYRLEPRPEILINLGKVCYSQGAVKRAAHYFAQAVLLDPRMMKEVPEDFREKVSDALRSQDDANGADED